MNNQLKERIKTCISLEPKWIQNKTKFKLTRYLIRLLFLPVYLIVICYVCVKKYVYLPYIEVPITTKCSLKCKACGNLMQYYNNAYDLSYEEIKQEIDKLLNCVNRIRVVTVLGGEPFVHKDLDKICDYLIKQKKIEQVLVITNGTIIPKNADLIKVLKNKKVRVKISDYGELSRKSSELGELLEKNSIEYSIVFDPAGDNNYWIDYGQFECRNRTEEELTMQFKRCTNENVCRSYFKGKLFKCPRSGHAMDLSFIKTPESDYVDFMNTSLNRRQLKKQLIQWEKAQNSISACNYCDWGTDNVHLIPVAEQMK